MKDRVAIVIVKYQEAETCEEIFKQFLNAEELSQADKFTLHLRTNFILRRGLLKLLIGKMLEIDPVQIQVHCTAMGKPYCSHLYFNYSDSNEYVVFAFSKKHDLGIDIEFIDQEFDYRAVLNEVLTPRELEIYLALSADRKRKIFYDLWTGKEAYLKYLGLDLTSLQNVEYEIMTDQKIKLKNRGGIPHYQSIDFDENYSSALICDSVDPPLVTHLRGPFI